jgi:hypothetical protein
MTHSQISGRFGQQQVARFLTDVASETRSRFIVTNPKADIYKVYTLPTAQLSFSGSADDVLEFLDKSQDVALEISCHLS